MAEFVEINFERSISELEKLLALKLFDSSEIKKIAQQRRNNAYNLQKRTKDKEDYLRYIAYEEDLLQRIKDKRHELGIKDKQAEVDVQMARRLHMFFRNSLDRNKSDVDFWMAYFRYCDKHRMHRDGGKMIQLMLQVHGDKPHLYKFGSQFALKERIKKKPNYETGRYWLIRGLERHADNKELYEALVQFDLDILERAVAENDEDSREKSLKCIEISFNNAVRAIPEVQFITHLTHLISQYPLTENITKLAMQLLENYHTDSVESRSGQAEWAFLHAAPADTNLNPKQLKKYRAEEAVKILQKAVEEVPTPQMWAKYIDFLKSHQDPNDSYLTDILYRSALPYVTDSKLGREEDFVLLAEFYLRETREPFRAFKTLEEATEIYQSSAYMWYERIRAYLSLSRTENALGVFNQSLPKLKQVPAKDTVRIWTMMTSCLLEEDKDKIEEIYREGLKYRADLAQLLKPSYLQWRFVSCGLEKARELLNDIYVTNPPCLPFYRKLVQIEESAPNPDLLKCRDCYETILRLFGTNNADLWLDYITFEMKKGDAKQVAKIYDRGVRNLKKDEADVLATKYSLMF